MKYPKFAFPVALAIILLSGIFIGFKIKDDGDDFELAKSFDIFHNVVREIRLLYVDDIDASKLINQATVEFLQKLDPYTVFYPESDIEEFDFMTTGAYGGIGAAIVEFRDKLLVTDIKKDSPADKAGLKIGDYIQSINNITVTQKNASDVKELIKGEPGSILSLKIKRYGSETLIEKKVTREKIQLENIPFSYLIENKYAYIQLNQFNLNAGSNLKQKLTELNSQSKLEGIILDLRGNPGGLLIEAVNIAGLFLPKNSVVVSTRGRITDANHEYKTSGEPAFPDIPVVVLINKFSASASEIVAGALQDYDRAVIVGQRSYGKGLVQLTRKMNYNTGIKLTTAKYYIPSGRCIQAIDYSHRNADGSVGHIPDSLISLFKTKVGRNVYDGGGISPDVNVIIDSLSGFTTDLFRNNLFYDFANQYVFEHSTAEKPENFKITDEIVYDFADFIKSEKFTYVSRSEKLTENLFNSASEENYDQNTIDKIISLQSDLKTDVDFALNSYKKEIIPILFSEIMKRYYYQNELIAALNKYDEDLKKALEIIKNDSEIKKILSANSEK